MRQDIGRRRWLQSVLAAGCCVAGLPARAATGKVVFGFAQASVGFPMATQLLQEIAGRYQPELGREVTYLPGNVGALAIDAVHRAPADGATVLLTPSSVMTLLPHLRTLPQVDPVRDFVPVAAMALIGVALAVGTHVPGSVKTLKDHADWVRQNPLQAIYGLPGLGTAVHVNGAMLARAFDVPLKPAAYKGTAAIAADLVSGSLPAGFLVGGVAMQAALARGVRLLAVTGDQRWPSQPDVPTMRESGVTDLPPAESFGFFMSARTPATQVRELGDAIRNALRSPRMQAARDDNWHLPLPPAADDYASMVAQERARWGELVKAYRFSAEA